MTALELLFLPLAMAGIVFMLTGMYVWSEALVHMIHYWRAERRFKRMVDDISADLAMGVLKGNIHNPGKEGLREQYGATGEEG